MTEEQKKEKNREAQRRFRENNREKFNEYHKNYSRRKYEELQRLRDFYHQHMVSE